MNESVFTLGKQSARFPIKRGVQLLKGKVWHFQPYAQSTNSYISFKHTQRRIRTAPKHIRQPIQRDERTKNINQFVQDELIDFDRRHFELKL